MQHILASLPLIVIFFLGKQKINSIFTFNSLWTCLYVSTNFSILEWVFVCCLSSFPPFVIIFYLISHFTCLSCFNQQTEFRISTEIRNSLFFHFDVSVQSWFISRVHHTILLQPVVINQFFASETVKFSLHLHSQYEWASISLSPCVILQMYSVTQALHPVAACFHQ